MLIVNAAPVTRKAFYSAIRLCDNYETNGKYYILLSYVSGFQANRVIVDYCSRLPHYGGLVLDSGAYTYIYARKEQEQKRFSADDAKKLIRKYARMINELNPMYAIELDFYYLGVDAVEELRRELEDLTSRPIVPVWHKFLGVDYWYSLVDRYRLVSIGGAASKEIDVRRDKELIQCLVNYAHGKKVFVHGLGVSPTEANRDFFLETGFDAIDTSYSHYACGAYTAVLFLTGEKTLYKMDLNKAIKKYKHWRLLFRGKTAQEVDKILYATNYKIMLDFSAEHADVADENFLMYLWNYAKR